MLCIRAAAADETSPAEVSVIHFANGSHASGTLIDGDDGSHLNWQSPAFVKPFAFLQSQVNAVHFPLPAKLTQAEGEYCFELAGGDVLFGSLVSLNPEEIVVDATGLGPLHIRRTLLRRMYRWKGGSELLYFGPSGLAGWTVSAGTKAWTEEAGQLLSSQEGAVIRRDFHAPTLARFEVELSWKEKPDFEMALGVGDAKSALRAFRFEVWANQIVAMRETETAADVTNLQTIKSGAGRIQLQAFLDQQKGKLLVFSSSGTPLADMTVTTSKPHHYGGIQLTNKSGDVRLERLCISRWNGETPQAVDLDKSRIHKSDGSIVYGQLKSFENDNRQFVVDAEGGQQRVTQEQLQDVFFSQQPEVPARSLTAVFLNDQRISGDLLKVENNIVWLKSLAIQEPIKAPTQSLRTLFGLNSKQADKLPKDKNAKPRTGRLELPGTMLQGYLVDSPVDDLKTLCWQPLDSSTASSLQPGVSGKIVYRDPPAVPTTQLQATMMQARAVNRGIVRESSDQAATAPAKGKQKKPILHLRSGDMIPCDQATIDENGVTFSSPMTDATFIRNDQIKVLELVPDIASIEITKQKKERLLMLPRMQRDNPPTQLIRSIDGDYLKGRLLSMDEQQLQIEIRLETKALQRDRIARIIWLHADELDASAKRPAMDQGIEGTRIQVLTDNPQESAISRSTTGETAAQRVSVGSPNRLTFVAQQLEGTNLSGRSELLGVCRVDLTKIDRILIENAIEEDAAKLTFHQWKLRSAADPVAAREGGADGGEGQESALVGKIAPDIELDTLAGGKFKLSERRDKIIVLDFWASWCGPCLQAMPQVDKVAHEFADRGVELMAINLEEKEDRIKAALERLKLETPVALDRDGRIAEKYGATAIPQTVIIDRDGKVARLFVGGGPRFGDQLRSAIESVLSGKSEMPE